MEGESRRHTIADLSPRSQERSSHPRQRYLDGNSNLPFGLGASLLINRAIARSRCASVRRDAIAIGECLAGQQFARFVITLE